MASSEFRISNQKLKIVTFRCSFRSIRQRMCERNTLFSDDIE